MSIKLKLLFPIFLQIILCSFDLFAQANSKSYYPKNGSSEFLSQDRLTFEIDINDVQLDVLDAAIFHLTNLEREKENLPPFDFYEPLYESSILHSEYMINEDFFSHENPYKRKFKTPKDRMFHFDDNFKAVAENILENFLLNYSGTRLKYRIEYASDGTLVYTNPKGEIIPYASYIQLARRLVKQWMDSPPHRVNILNERFDLLGCACAINYEKVPAIVRCTQNFGSLVYK
jgi:uncharacterized protein YkwD